MKENIQIVLVTAGMLMIMAAIAIPIFTHDITSDIFRYIYAAGAVMHLVGRIMRTYDGNNTRVKRLLRIETWGALFFCAAAVLLFYDKANLRDPIALTLAAGMIQIYTSIMLPKVSKKM